MQMLDYTDSVYQEKSPDATRNLFRRRPGAHRKAIAGHLPVEESTNPLALRRQEKWEERFKAEHFGK